MDHVETAPRLNGAGEFAIKQQVGKILRSRGFASERHARLLKYLLAKTLDGGVAELKEYTLAVEVFHRSEDFDPQTDAIVRTELSRLRGKLKSYYENEGQRDELLVDLPNRSYSLTFTLRSEVPRPVAARSPKWGWIGASAVASVCLTPCVAYLLWWASDTGKWAAVEPDVNVVAVLPFANPDGNPEVEHFSNSLMDEVIRCLGEIDGLRVISRNSALPLKDTAEHLRSSAAKLNVGVIVEGAVYRSGDKLRIATRLVNPNDGAQIYSRSYEHHIHDAFTALHDIAGQVVNELRIRHNAEKQARRFATSVHVRDLYLQGLQHANRSSESGLRRAIDYYQQAIEMDASYAPAHASIAEAYITLALLDEIPPGDAMHRAEQAARTALRFGDQLPHGHSVLASVLALYYWDWVNAEKEFRRAIDLDPNDSVIRQQYAMRCLVPQGHLDSALLELQLAQQVDPFSAHVILNRGRISYFKRDFALAIEAFRKVMELEPAFEVVPLPLAEAYLESLRLEEGFKTLQDASAPTGDEARLALLGRGYGLSEQPHRARQVLRQLKEVARHQHVSGYYLSQVHLALGETSPAMDWLERAASERSPVIAYVGVAPQFDALRPDPRFRALLKRIGID